MKTPQLNFAHLCDSAFLSQDKKLNIIGVFEKIYAQKFPFRYPKIAVVINITAPKGKYKLTVQMMKKGDSKPVLQMQGDIGAEAEQKFNLIIDFQNIPFEDQRKYAVEILVDKDKLTTLNFAVELPPQSKL